MNKISLASFLVATVLAEITESKQVAGTEDEAPPAGTIAHNQLIFWVPILMIFIALSFGWKIVQDNEPDTQRDSILYSKFLTQKVERGKIE